MRWASSLPTRAVAQQRPRSPWGQRCAAGRDLPRSVGPVSETSEPRSGGRAQSTDCRPSTGPWTDLGRWDTSRRAEDRAVATWWSPFADTVEPENRIDGDSVVTLFRGGCPKLQSTTGTRKPPNGAVDTIQGT